MILIRRITVWPTVLKFLADSYMKNSLEEGKSRSRENSQEARAIVQVRLDGGLTLVVRVKMDQVDRSKLEPQQMD